MDSITENQNEPIYSGAGDCMCGDPRWVEFQEELMSKPSVLTAQEWAKLSPESRHRINKFMMMSQRIARKFALEANAINEADNIALQEVLGEDWQEVNLSE